MRTVAEFQIQYLRYLDPQGRPLGDLPAFANDDAELLKMYRAMVLARTFDTKAINLQRTGKLGTYASCLGHEATHVGVGAAMRPEDGVAIVYREIGAQFWRGVRMSEILLYWGGDERGNDFAGPAPRLSLVRADRHADACTRPARRWRFKIRGEPRCAVAVHRRRRHVGGRVLRSASTSPAPRSCRSCSSIVNNEWAISVPLELQTAAQTLAQKGIAAGMPGVQVDGNDVIAVRARRGDGARARPRGRRTDASSRR